MLIKNLEVSEIVLTKIDSKAHKLSLQINFSNDTSEYIEMTLEDNFEIVIDKLLKQIKTRKKPVDNNNDDFLSGISIVNIKNEEDIKEKAPKRLIMLDRRLDTLKQTKHHKEYMNLFHQLSTMQDVIYQK